MLLSVAIIALVFSPILSASAEEELEGLSAQQLRTVNNGVRSAFLIPQGYAVTPNIRAPLQKIYDTYEPPLRRKLIAMQTVTEPEQKKQLVQEITQIRQQVQYQAMAIFQAERARIYREMEAKRQKQLAEMRKKQQQQRKKHGKKKKRRR